MACYNLGDYICESRKQLGITQEELAFGICSTGTLSKIENGFVVPKRKNYEAIMQRLGKTMGICNIRATAEEMELYAYMRQLVHAVANNDMEGSRELWQRQPEHKQEDKLTRQFFSYIKAVLDSKEGVRPELVYAKLEEALHLTHPAGLANLVQKRMFTFEEINIINSIEPYDVFLDGLCKSKEDKDQVCKLFPIIMELHEDDYDIFCNTDLFSSILMNQSNR